MTIELKGLRGLNGLNSLMNASQDLILNDLVDSSSIPIERIISSKLQPRQEFASKALFDLSESIKAQGVIQPLIVRPVGEKYEIVAGERRWRAAKLAGLTELPVIIKTVSDETALALALIENLQREDLRPLEQAFAFTRLKEEFGMSDQDIGDILSQSRSSVTNSIRLLKLCSEVKELLAADKLEMGHARALLGLGEDEQLKTATYICDNQLSVREAEELIKRMKIAAETAKDPFSMLSHTAKSWVEQLTNKMQPDLKIQLTEKGEGKLMIKFKSLDELEWLAEHLKID